ncbi:hypothetical protein D3C85_921170 [compost metagenome]
MRGVAGDFLGGGAELIDRGGDAAGARGLLVRVEHRGVGSGHHTQCHFVDLAGGRRHFADRTVDALDETVECRAENAELIVVHNAQAFGQVAFAVGNAYHRTGHGVQRLNEETYQHTQQGDDDGHGDHCRNGRRKAEMAEHREGFVFLH